MFNFSSFKINNKPIYAFPSSLFGLSLTISQEGPFPIREKAIEMLIWT
jgi:hypothetical protein